MRGSDILAGDILGGAKLIRYVPPSCPDFARKQNLEGTVDFAGTIAKDDPVVDLAFVKGRMQLVPYARDAVRQCRYQPLRFHGAAVETKTYIAIPFASR